MYREKEEPVVVVIKLTRSEVEAIIATHLKQTCVVPGDVVALPGAYELDMKFIGGHDITKLDDTAAVYRVSYRRDVPSSPVEQTRVGGRCSCGEKKEHFRDGLWRCVACGAEAP